MDRKTHFTYLATIVIVICWGLNMRIGIFSKGVNTKIKIKANENLVTDDNKQKPKIKHNVSEAIPHRINLTDQHDQRHKSKTKNDSLNHMAKQHTIFKFPFFSKKVTTANCKHLFEGRTYDIQRVVSISNYTLPKELKALDYLKLAVNCSSFIQSRGYITDPLTEEEKHFPIAFSILIYKDMFQFERLIRAIYRPQNYYCVHVDRKCEKSFILAVLAITTCFDNVFLASDLVDVHWGHFSTVQPELNCMKDLLKFQKWKYFINLTGQEFPLRTNYELVKILKVYNGANDIKKGATYREDYKQRLKSAGPPPYGLKPVKGPAHIVVNRYFVEYVIYNRKAKDILWWARKVTIPDETVFSSMNNNPHLGIKGAYTGSNNVESASRYKIWGPALCFGKFVRDICIFGTRDLPVLHKAKQMFVNKVYWNFHHFVLDCLEENIFERAREQYLGNVDFDDKYYRNLDFVKHHLK